MVKNPVDRDYNVEDSTLLLLKRDIFYSFYVENIMCDIQIKSLDSKIIHAHKLVLSALSTYFRAQFSFNENVQTVLLPFLYDDLKTILDYIYTGKIFHVTIENIITLMEMEDYLQIASLKCWLSEFLVDSISKEKVWIIKRKADFLRYKDVTYKADSFISSHFGELLQTSEMLEIHHELLTECLKREFLAVNSEDDLLYFLVKWILHDEKRIEHVEILNTIDVMAVKNWSETRAKILELEPHNLIVEWLNSAFNRRKVISPNELYRYKQISEFVLLSIGGLNSSDALVGSVDCNADIKLSNWKPIISLTPPGSKVQKQLLIPVMITPRRNPMVYSKNDSVYVLGGTIKNIEFEVYNLTNNEWTKLPDFPLEMSRPPSMVVVNGNVFCAGGLDIKMRVSDNFWVLYENSKTWKKLKPMKYERYNPCLVDFFGSIFCFGGKEEDDNYSHNVEKYEPILDVWFDVIELDSYPLECIPWKNFIFIILEEGYLTYCPMSGKKHFNPKKLGDLPTLFELHCCCSCVNGDLIINGSDEEKLTVFNIVRKSYVSYQSKRRKYSALSWISVPMFKNPEV